MRRGKPVRRLLEFMQLRDGGDLDQVKAVEMDATGEFQMNF